MREMNKSSQSDNRGRTAFSESNSAQQIREIRTSAERRIEIWRRIDGTPKSSVSKSNAVLSPAKQS